MNSAVGHASVGEVCLTSDSLFSEDGLDSFPGRLVVVRRGMLRHRLR